jgi:hypothetical protein
MWVGDFGSALDKVGNLALTPRESSLQTRKLSVLVGLPN